MPQTYSPCCNAHLTQASSCTRRGMSSHVLPRLPAPAARLSFPSRPELT